MTAPGPGDPDLDRLRDAVRLRDQCREAAMAHHARCGLAPSFEYANATYDAIVDLIREAVANPPR